MMPPLFKVCASNPHVVRVFGLNPVRIFPWGQAFDESGLIPKTPYAVWSVINGTGQAYLENRSDLDEIDTQIDVYGESEKIVLQAAEIIRQAIEKESYVTSFVPLGIDQEAQLLRFTMTATWHVPRLFS